MQTVKQRVAEMIKVPGKVLVFSKTWCPYCTEAKEILGMAEVAFEAFELDKMAAEGEQMQAALGEITGQKTVPNIFIGGVHIGGCSDLKDKIKSGKVLQILDQAGIPYNL